MIVLNLISEELRNEIKLKKLYIILKNSYFVLLILTIVVSIIFLIAKIVLQENFNNVVSQTTLITKNSQEYNSKIREINSKINSISLIQNDYVPWTNILDVLVSTVPDDISFSYLKISQDNKSIKIKGVSATRDSLLLLKTNLEKSNLFLEVNLPLSNILEKNNIYFEIDTKIKLENIK